MKWWQSPVLEKIYGFAAGAKNFLFDAGFADALHLGKPVISIGNLTVGGTGKTPFTQMLLNRLREEHVRAVVVGRNYKGTLKGTARVEPNRPLAAFQFGDEPTLLASRNPDIPVYVGPSKWLAAYHAVKDVNPDVIVIDDGFQHRALHRDLDLVLLDASVDLQDYDLLPRGKGRESMASLSRADFIILSKVNLVDELQVETLRRLLPADAKIIELAYRLESPVEDAGIKVIAIAGLAQPETFRKSLIQDTMYELVDFLPYADHHPYSVEDLQKIRDVMIEKGAAVVVMTEKDFVKIDPLLKNHAILTPEQIRVLPLQTHFLSGADEFYKILDEVLAKFGILRV